MRLCAYVRQCVCVVALVAMVVPVAVVPVASVAPVAPVAVATVAWLMTLRLLRGERRRMDGWMDGMYGWDGMTLRPLLYLALQEFWCVPILKECVRDFLRFGCPFL